MFIKELINNLSAVSSRTLARGSAWTGLQLPGKHFIKKIFESDLLLIVTDSFYIEIILIGTPFQVCMKMSDGIGDHVKPGGIAVRRRHFL